MDALEGEALLAKEASDGGAPPDRLVGLVAWVRSGTEAEIRGVAVAAACRRRGIASALLAEAHNALREAGVRSTWLTTTNDNRSAIALYERMGYRLGEVRHGAVDTLRCTIKPSLPAFADDGTPISDELVFLLDLG